VSSGSGLLAEVLALRTPTLPPATTTNALCLGGERFLVIEPATPDPTEQARLIDLVARLRADGREPVALVVTHHHSDHVGAVERLQDALALPLWAHGATAQRVRWPVARELADGDLLVLGGVEVEVVHTPGHAPGHVVLWERGSGLAHGGDMIAGLGTILIDPDDDGSMATYLDSLRRLAALPLTRVVPAHGPAIDDPGAVFAHYIAHRLAREAKLLGALSTRPAGLAELVSRVYDDVDPRLHGVAGRSLRAHLEKLVAEGRARASVRASGWVLGDAAAP
jgi:glyoxylase-like metal-dependent hydrolase (beta-lactamase superfamily II)